MRRKKLWVWLFLAAMLSIVSGCGAKTVRRAAVQSGERQFTAPAEGDLIAVFTTSMGEIRAVLYPDAAPMAVQNFVGLARTGYYDGTLIWKVQSGFAVQGGDPSGTGTGGGTIWSNNPYPLEASDSLRHYAGALCAAFSAQGGTGQFYFVAALPDSIGKARRQELTENGYPESQADAYAAAGGLPYLDNTDTVFGQVYEGMAVVDAMAAAETEKDENKQPTTRPAGEIVVQHVLVTTYPGPTADELAEQYALQ